MHLPSFMWLWRIAAWSMGFTITAYILLAMLGLILRQQRLQQKSWFRRGLRVLHYSLGGILVFLVLLLLAIGIVGTLGHFGSLGHSWHFAAGLIVVALTLASAWSANHISPRKPWARQVHLICNGLLFVGLAWVSWTGWVAVQKYLP